MAGLRDNSVDKRRLNAQDKSQWQNAKAISQTRLASVMRGAYAYEENRPKPTTLKPSQMGGDTLFNPIAPRQTAFIEEGLKQRRSEQLRGT